MDETDETDTPSIGAAPASIASSEAKRAIEAIVMVSDEPADPRLLAQLIEVSPSMIDEICEELAAEYAAADRGFVLARVAGGWRFQSHPDLAPYVERFVLTGQSARLSAAALETLSIVAYKQPISRAQVAAIRGVNVDGVMRTLQQRGYIAELARDPGPGQAVLFGTTSLFLERLGLDSLDDLAPLGDFVPSAAVIEALESGLRVHEHDGETEVADESAAAGEGDEPVEGDVDVVDVTEAIDEVDLTDGAPVAEPAVAEPTEVEPIEALEALEVLADDRDA